MSRAVPHSAVQLAREGIVLAGAGAAIALQVADPAVAAGVARQSNFTADPLGRLRRTLQYIFSVVLPEAAPARSTVTDWVARVHAPVAGVAGGTVYSAADPVTQRWVTATLYWTAEQVRWRMWGTSDAAEAEEIYQSYAVLGTALGMPAEAWPRIGPLFSRTGMPGSPILWSRMRPVKFWSSSSPHAKHPAGCKLQCRPQNS